VEPLPALVKAARLAARKGDMLPALVLADLFLDYTLEYLEQKFF
jgi:hypothetical protein